MSPLKQLFASREIGWMIHRNRNRGANRFAA
jgi:hypothetical protein